MHKIEAMEHGMEQPKVQTMLQHREQVQRLVNRPATRLSGAGIKSLFSSFSLCFEKNFLYLQGE